MFKDFCMCVYVCVCVSLKGLIEYYRPIFHVFQDIFQPFQVKTLNPTIMVKNAYYVSILFVAFLGHLKGWENG